MTRLLEAAAFGRCDGSSKATTGAATGAGVTRVAMRGNGDEGPVARGHEQGPGRPGDVGKRTARGCVRRRRGGDIGEGP